MKSKTPKKTSKPSRAASKALAVQPVEPVAISAKADGLKEMTIIDLEKIDTGLRWLPEKLEKMSGVCAVLSGLVLTELKGRLTHGQWQPWLEKHYGKSKRTARAKMQIADAFTKSIKRIPFEPQQLTLSILEDPQSGALALNHPVVMAVDQWAGGRGFKLLLREEGGDGRNSNPGGFRPNALILNAWLKQEYPDHPEYRESDTFTDLPLEVQERFKKECARYEKRLTKEQRAEIEREEEAEEWLRRGETAVSAFIDRGYAEFAKIETLQSLARLFQDAAAEANRKLEAKRKAARNGAAELPKTPSIRGQN